MGIGVADGPAADADRVALGVGPVGAVVSVGVAAAQPASSTNVATTPSRRIIGCDRLSISASRAQERGVLGDVAAARSAWSSPHAESKPVWSARQSQQVPLVGKSRVLGRVSASSGPVAMWTVPYPARFAAWLETATGGAPLIGSPPVGFCSPKLGQRILRLRVEADGDATAGMTAIPARITSTSCRPLGGTVMSTEPAVSVGGAVGSLVSPLT